MTIKDLKTIPSKFPIIKSWRAEIDIDHPIAQVNVYHVCSPKDCAFIISEGERIAQLRGGWCTQRHSGVPTTDIPFTQLGGKNPKRFLHWRKRLEKTILTPILRRDYNMEFLSFRDLFLVRYHPTEQPSLRVHRDETPISFVIQLNEDFEGGGTYIESLQTSVKHQTGDMCIHSGWLRHGASATTEGARYVLIGFCNVRALWIDSEATCPGYLPTSDTIALKRLFKEEFRP